MNSNRSLRLGFFLALSVAACKPTERAVEKAAALPMPGSTPVPADEKPGMAKALDQRYPGDKAKQEDMRGAMRQLDAKLAAEDRLAAIHQRRMVAPASPDFKPEPVDRKIVLRLVLENGKIKAGGRPRVRLELTNVGRKPLDYSETRSSFFVMDGGLLDSPTIRFYVKGARSNWSQLLPPTIAPPAAPGATLRRPSPPKGLTPAELDQWFEDTNAMGQAHASFKVKLLPGETLRSVGDDARAGGFKTLRSEDSFRTPGLYRLKVELDDRPAPLTKEFIDYMLETGSTMEQIYAGHKEESRNALGPASAEAAFEVTK